MINVASVLKTARGVVTANSPALLVGTAIAGVVATGVLAAKGGYQARGIIDEAQADSTEDLTLQRKVQLTWLCYAAPALTGASTIAAVVGVHTIHTKRHAALAGIYAITSGKLDDYQSKAEELLGPKKSQQLTNDVAQAQVDRDPTAANEVVVTNKGTNLFHDSISGRYFDSSMDVVDRGVGALNLELAKNGQAVLGDFYEVVGLPLTHVGSDYGWDRTKMKGTDEVTVKYGSINTPDGRSAVSISFHPHPVTDF